jgi:hypothetical protein
LPNNEFQPWNPLLLSCAARSHCCTTISSNKGSCWIPLLHNSGSYWIPLLQKKMELNHTDRRTEDR